MLKERYINTHIYILLIYIYIYIIYTERETYIQNKQLEELLRPSSSPPHALQDRWYLCKILESLQGPLRDAVSQCSTHNMNRLYHEFTVSFGVRMKFHLTSKPTNATLLRNHQLKHKAEFHVGTNGLYRLHDFHMSNLLFLEKQAPTMHERPAVDGYEPNITQYRILTNINRY